MTNADEIWLKEMKKEKNKDLLNMNQKEEKRGNLERSTYV